jgi:extracellular factor (EF) 3-hydroxypalmitic acid methyl ester biosynthesis protein
VLTKEGRNNDRFPVYTTFLCCLRSSKTDFPERMPFTDLVYAAGLYDYLNERVAIRLTRQMFETLAPGGRLLIANFAPTLRDIGYMETYMGWKVKYRTRDDMKALSADIPLHAIASHRVFGDAFSNIVFLEVTKRA